MVNASSLCKYLRSHKVNLTKRNCPLRPGNTPDPLTSTVSANPLLISEEEVDEGKYPLHLQCRQSLHYDAHCHEA